MNMKNQFGLYVILTDPVAGYETSARAAIDCGVRYLQLRMKHAAHNTVLETALKLRELTRNTKTRLIINDDITIAVESDADGIHLGQDDLSIAEARTIWPAPGKLFGLSSHSLEQASQALKLKPDYLGVGPVFPTATKPDAAPCLGIAEAGRIVKSIPIPTVAIGGINSKTLAPVLAAGVRNFCAVSAVNSAPDPVAAIRTLQEIWKAFVFELERS